ncbi:MAG: LicD family protein [Clostridia bacterium]|nr:LicD family protein [Clostridia bacterium]
MSRFNREKEQEVRDLILQYGACDYDPHISNADYEAFYHLSSLRHSLLSWYPFRKDANVLEVSGGYGAMTGLYLERFPGVTVLEQDAEKANMLRRRFSGTRLEVIEASLETYETQERYDYLFLIDTDELYTQPLEQVVRRAKELLKEDGRLFLGIRNRNAFKYECGALDEYVTEPFQVQRLPGKREAEQAAQGIFSQIMVYLPLPDFSYAQMIVTQEDLPAEGIQDRVFSFDPFESPLFRNEDEALGQAVTSGTIGDRANFYLFEMSETELPCRVTRAVLSQDRGERAWATVMRSDGTVEKKALRREGIRTLRASYEYLEEIRSRGLETVPQRWEEDRIVMPRVEEPGLLETIRVYAERHEKEEVLTLFDRMWENILGSSEEADPAEQTEEWNVTAEEAGPYLQKGWIDLIPYNAFYANGRIRYYDQEFCVRNCPAKYILYRAIHYTWLHLPGLEQVIPQQELFLRFGISEKAQRVYQAREDRFVSENRNWARYGQIYSWAQSAKDRARDNLDRITEQRRLDLMKEVHTVQLGLLKEFDRFCAENGLVYTALHGTLLGAVRHGGFIPWDEDLDVGMPREDFEKLLSLYRNREGRPYLQTMRNDAAIFYGGYAKLRDEYSTGIEAYNLHRRAHKGIWIDILPLDLCEEDPVKRQRHQDRITRIQRCIIAKLYPRDVPLLWGTRLRQIVALYSPLNKMIPLGVYYRLLDREFRKVRKSGHRTIFACYYGGMKNRNLFAQKELEKLVRLPFEDMRIPAPEAYEAWLRSRYGPRYMEPVRGNDRHADIVFDTEKPYWKEEGTKP